MFKEQAQHDYEELIALGGRPTRPLHSPFLSNATVDSGKIDHRAETEIVDMVRNADMTSDAEGLLARHWTEESWKWDQDLMEWNKFKRIQLFKTRSRSELELELENTDVGLVEVLSKLNDWQDFHLIKQKEVFELGIRHEKCQEAITRSQNTTPVASDAESKQKIEASFGKLMWDMENSQKALENSQEKLMWIESQWTEVLAEASHSIAGEPKLQKQLEDKFEKQTSAIYRRLQQLEAKPSHVLHPPNESAEFPQRLQHWISESSNFTAEMWDWKVFMAWQKRAKGTETTKEEEQKQPAQSESCAELFEDMVKYCQHKVDGVFSWMVCWRSLARQHMESRHRRRNMSLLWPSLPGNNDDADYNDYDDYDDYDDDDDEDVKYDSKSDLAKAREAKFFAQQAEQKVPKAAERLERSKQELQSILAQNGQPSTGAIPAETSDTQLPPTPPKSESPESLPKNRRPSNKSRPTEKGHRRLKKEKVRKEGARMGNTNIEQQPLPTFNPDPNVEEAEDTEMSDVSGDPSPPETVNDLGESECDTIMSDVEDAPNPIPPSLSESHPRPTTNTKSRKTPSSTAQASTSRKTRSATKLDRVISGAIPKKNIIGKTTKFTEQQTTALLNATTGYDPTTPITLRRSERLKEKATASAATSSPTSSPSSNAIASPTLTREKKRKRQPDVLESPQTSRQKKIKI